MKRTELAPTLRTSEGVTAGAYRVLSVKLLVQEIALPTVADMRRVRL